MDYCWIGYMFELMYVYIFLEIISEGAVQMKIFYATIPSRTVYINIPFHVPLSDLDRLKDKINILRFIKSKDCFQQEQHVNSYV